MEQVGTMGGTTTIVHFVYSLVLPPGDDEPEGPPSLQWRIACMPNMREFHSTPYHPNYQRTDSVAAVTCPACRRTPAYDQARGM